MRITKRGLVVLYSGVAILLVTYPFQAHFMKWAEQTYLRRTIGPNLDTVLALDAQYRSAARGAVFGVGRGVGSRRSSATPGNLSHLTGFYFYYVPVESSLAALRFAGVTVREVTRYDMAFATDTPYRGYVVIIGGVAAPHVWPQAWLGNQVVDLVKKGSDYENLGARGRLYEAVRDNSEPGGALPEKSCFRTFLPVPGEHVRAVCAIGRPVFEDDFYSRGEWTGSFAVWRTRAEADSARLEKVQIPRVTGQGRLVFLLIEAALGIPGD